VLKRRAFSTALLQQLMLPIGFRLAQALSAKAAGPSAYIRNRFLFSSRRSSKHYFSRGLSLYSEV